MTPCYPDSVSSNAIIQEIQALPPGEQLKVIHYALNSRRPANSRPMNWRIWQKNWQTRPIQPRSSA
jgi:hypothetical protein